ncbi:trypsin-like serine peptidase [Corynebacterium glyciniphilum]|nr:serine protease [Corynebacterium glyciniphilum]
MTLTTRKTPLVSSLAVAVAISLATAITSATAAPTTGLDIRPVGYNIVDGHQDLDNPITNTDITADTGTTITEASNGSYRTPRKVIDDDDRQQVEETRTSPYRRVGQLTFQTGTDSYICTGWLISPDTVATAGHCLADNSSNITFSPGRNGSVNPFGTQNATQVWYDQDFGQEGRDWGAIKLDKPVGDNVGWFGITSTDGEDLIGDDARIIGYPGDKPSGTLWQHTGEVTASDARRVTYNTDTFGGQSGSAVTDDTGDIAYGIHVAGTPEKNWATRITGELFNTLVNITRQ